MGSGINQCQGQRTLVGSSISSIPLERYACNVLVQRNKHGGIMCNEDGDGVEFGVFVDDECRYYHSGKNFQKVMDSDDYYYFSKAPEVVQFMFTKSITCAADDAVQFVNAYQPI
jgi:hypothetical protein